MTRYTAARRLNRGQSLAEFSLLIVLILAVLVFALVQFAAPHVFATFQ